MPSIRHQTVRVSDLNIFVRAAGDPARPTLVLLHRFPSSSRQSTSPSAQNWESRSRTADAAS